jgi:hypothetical protein
MSKAAGRRFEDTMRGEQPQDAPEGVRLDVHVRREVGCGTWFVAQDVSHAEIRYDMKTTRKDISTGELLNGFERTDVGHRCSPCRHI